MADEAAPSTESVLEDLLGHSGCFPQEESPEEKARAHLRAEIEARGIGRARARVEAKIEAMHNEERRRVREAEETMLLATSEAAKKVCIRGTRGGFALWPQNRLCP